MTAHFLSQGRLRPACGGLFALLLVACSSSTAPSATDDAQSELPAVTADGSTAEPSDATSEADAAPPDADASGDASAPEDAGDADAPDDAGDGSPSDAGAEGDAAVDAALPCADGLLDCNGLSDDACEVDSRSDSAHCGGCGQACPAVENAAAACVAGRCGLGACGDGYGDCNGDERDGCEVDLRASLESCGACGKGCTIANGTPLCSAAVCTVGSCQVGFGDCNGDAADGCEVRTSADLLHCGACGAPCPALPNAVSSCAGGRCALGACLPGFRDCNGNPADGCEVNVNSDPNHCGGCGLRCSFPRAVAGCSAQVCTIARCALGYGNCNGSAADGCERPLDSDTYNCGACGLSCAPYGDCAGSMCRF